MPLLTEHSKTLNAIYLVLVAASHALNYLACGVVPDLGTRGYSRTRVNSLDLTNRSDSISEVGPAIWLVGPTVR